MATDKDRIKASVKRIDKVRMHCVGDSNSLDAEELEYALAELNSVLNSPAMQVDIPAKELRRRYAAFALQGYLASPAAPANEHGEQDSSASNLARLAFAMADAMLEREK